jgi:hypothetical protein
MIQLWRRDLILWLYGKLVGTDNQHPPPSKAEREKETNNTHAEADKQSN